MKHYAQEWQDAWTTSSADENCTTEDFKLVEGEAFAVVCTSNNWWIEQWLFNNGSYWCKLQLPAQIPSINLKISGSRLQVSCQWGIGKLKYTEAISLTQWIEITTKFIQVQDFLSEVAVCLYKHCLLLTDKKPEILYFSGGLSRALEIRSVVLFV